jgi:hypothetical protein
MHYIYLPLLRHAKPCLLKGMHVYNTVQRNPYLVVATIWDSKLPSSFPLPLNISEHDFGVCTLQVVVVISSLRTMHNDDLLLHDLFYKMYTPKDIDDDITS